MLITAYFDGCPDDERERACHAVFRHYGGTFRGAGTWIVGANKGERDVEYDVPDERAEACREQLEDVGYRLEPRVEPRPGDISERTYGIEEEPGLGE